MKSTEEPNWCDHDYEISGRVGTGYLIMNLSTCKKCGHTKQDDYKETVGGAG